MIPRQQKMMVQSLQTIWKLMQRQREMMRMRQYLRRPMLKRQLRR